MSVKETAEAILATPDGEEHWGFCEAGVEFDDLRAMAKLWLKMRELSETNPAIFDIMNQADLVDSTPNQP